MKLKMNFGTAKTAILWAVAAVALVMCALNIAILVISARNGSNEAPLVVSSVSLAGCALLCAECMVMLFLSRYHFGEDKLTITLGVFKDKIMYDNVVVLRQNSHTGELFIVSDSPKSGGGQISTRVNLKGNDLDKFIDEMRRHVDELAIEMFTVSKG